jgi:nicotinamidase-related amidase
VTAVSGTLGRRFKSSPVVLLVIDAINDFRFAEGRQILPEASSMAERIRRLKRRAGRARIPTVYVNDNFGRWRSDFRTLIAHCLRPTSPGRFVTKLLRPGPLDYFVLKPKHSGFFSTTLDLLLEHFHARTLIMTGLLADSCILFTAQDAYMRGYDLVVPADCIAARTAEDRLRALAQMRRALRADTSRSTVLDLDAITRGANRTVHLGRRGG